MVEAVEEELQVMPLLLVQGAMAAAVRVVKVLLDPMELPIPVVVPELTVPAPDIVPETDPTTRLTDWVMVVLPLYRVIVPA